MRTDQQYLEKGLLREAEVEKARVEEIQRVASRTRTDVGETYAPRFFDLDDKGEYNFNQKYWEQRDDKKYWENIPKLW